MEHIKINKYISKRTVRNHKDTAEFIMSTWPLTLRDWLPVIEDMIYIAKKRVDSKLAMFRLQITILGDILTFERFTEDYGKLIKDPNTALELIPENESITQADKEHWEREIKNNRIILSAFRDVGDGIAWRVLRYNRSLLHIMGIHDPPGRTLLTPGLQSEIAALEDIVNDSSITHFVLHAITNSGRVGDITSVDKHGTVEFAEVKSKSNPRGKKWKDRIEKQSGRLQNLTTLANGRVGTLKQQNLVIKQIDGTPALSLQEICTVVREAQETGFAWRLLHPYLAIAALDRGVSGIAHEADAVLEKNKVKISTLVDNGEEKDRRIRTNSLIHNKFSPNRTPLSLYPLESSSIAAILLGRIIIFYDFNFDGFCRELAKEGWSVSNSFMEASLQNPADDFITITKEKLQIMVPGAMVARIVFEGMSVDSFILICNAMLEEGLRGGQNGIIYGFSGEAQLWE